MIGNAIFITAVILLAVGLFLLEECRFLVPYRHLLLNRYGGIIGPFIAAVFLNLLAVVYLACRYFFLKDTGRKLAHLEKQLRTGESLSDELSRRLDE